MDCECRWLRDVKAEWERYPTEDNRTWARRRLADNTEPCDTDIVREGELSYVGNWICPRCRQGYGQGGVCRNIVCRHCGRKVFIPGVGGTQP